VKSRGVGRSVFGAHREAFRAAFRAALRRGGSNLGSITVPLTLFVGHTLALHRGKPELAGRWLPVEKVVGFDYEGKRCGYERRGASALTFTQAGGRESVPYDKSFGHSLESEGFVQAMVRDEQPDFLQSLPDE
jgi:hypothetical protein